MALTAVCAPVTLSVAGYEECDSGHRPPGCRSRYVNFAGGDYCAHQMVAYAISEENYFKAINNVANIRRALPNSPRGYTPSSVECPESAPSVRSANTVSQNESAWLQTRRRNAVDSMRELLTRVNINGFDVGAYFDRHATNDTALPNIGLAFSGGGWRALMNGAGALAAFDSRTPGSTDQGNVGGLLQSSTYIAGLSGGSWLVGSIYTNNFTTVVASRDQVDGSLWEFGNSILEGPEQDGFQLFNTADYYKTIVDDVNGKRDAGFNASITDYWGRALSYQLINATDGGPSYTFSSIALTSSFQNGEQPFPLVVADGRAPGQVIVSLNSTIYEFNPFEMGSWDATVFGFLPTQYLGTNMTNGQVTDGEQCIVGFDNAGYIMGTSSSLFNQILLQANQTGLPEIAVTTIETVFGALAGEENDIADYEPNPFFGWNPATNLNADQASLTLVDGGEDLQNIPLYPLIQPVRNVDTIFAVDSSADTNNWPNATALVATYERSQNAIANGTGFPFIPDQNTIVNLGLNTRPTFFGCNSTNVTRSTANDVGVPLVVYLPNAPYSFFSNISTFQLTTSDADRDAIIQNGYNVATMANSTIDSEWPVCLACAMLSRSMERTNTQVPQACQTCFDRYCYNGTLASSTPPQYAPSLILNVTTNGGGGENGAASLMAGHHNLLPVIMAGLVTAMMLI